MSGREREIYICIYTVGYIMILVDIMIQHDTTYPIDCDVRHIWTMMKTSSTTLKQCFPGLCLCEVYVADQKITRSIGSDVQLSLHDLQYVAIKCLKAMGNNIHMQSQESKRILMIPVCWCTWECVLSGKLHLLLLNLDWSIFVTIFRSPPRLFANSPMTEAEARRGIGGHSHGFHAFAPHNFTSFHISQLID